MADQCYGHVAEVYVLSDAELLTDTWKGNNLKTNDINSMSQVIRLTKSTFIKKTVLWGNIFSIQI